MTSEEREAVRKRNAQRRAELETALEEQTPWLLEELGRTNAKEAAEFDALGFPTLTEEEFNALAADLLPPDPETG